MEQDGESLHHKLNALEKQYGCVKNKAEMFFLMIKELENKRKCDKLLFVKKTRSLKTWMLVQYSTQF